MWFNVVQPFIVRTHTVRSQTSLINKNNNKGKANENTHTHICTVCCSNTNSIEYQKWYWSSDFWHGILVGLHGAQNSIELGGWFSINDKRVNQISYNRIVGSEILARTL